MWRYCSLGNMGDLMKKEFNGPWLYQWRTSHLLNLKDKKEIIDLTKLIKTNKVIPFNKILKKV